MGLFGLGFGRGGGDIKPAQALSEIDAAGVDCLDSPNPASSSPAKKAGKDADAAKLCRRMRLDTRLQGHNTACVDMEAEVAIPAEVLFELLADPTCHEHIFDEIEAANSELLQSTPCGGQRVWRLDYRARWRFWKVSGVCENKMTMWTDREAGTVTFQLREPGFLRQYQGTWTIRPAEAAAATAARSATAAGPASALGPSEQQLPSRSHSGSSSGGGISRTGSSSSGSRGGMAGVLAAMQAQLQLGTAPQGSMSVVRAVTSCQPKISPPYPLNKTLKGQASGQVSDMLHGLLRAAAQRLDMANSNRDAAAAATAVDAASAPAPSIASAAERLSLLSEGGDWSAHVDELQQGLGVAPGRRSLQRRSSAGGRAALAHGSSSSSCSDSGSSSGGSSSLSSSPGFSSSRGSSSSSSGEVGHCVAASCEEIDGAASTLARCDVCADEGSVVVRG